MARRLLPVEPENIASAVGAAKEKSGMEAFVIGLLIGVAFGVVVVGFLAIGSYDRGFNEALLRRRAWRTELVARQAAAQRVLTGMRKAS